MACCQIHTASVRLYRAPTPVTWPLRVMPSLYTSHIVDPTTFVGSNPGHNVPFRKLRMWDSAPGLVPFLWNVGPDALDVTAGVVVDRAPFRLFTPESQV